MTSNGPLKTLLCALAVGGIVFAGGVSCAHAQAGPQGWGGSGIMAGGGGLETSTTVLFPRPAQLALGPRRAPLQVRVLDLQAAVGGDLLQFDHYERTFGEQSGTLTNTEEAKVLDEWFGDEQRGVTTHTQVTPVALTYRPVDKSWALGVGVRAQVRSEAKIDRGVPELFAVGADSNRTVPLSGGQRTLSTVDLTGAFSYRLESIPLSIGVAPRVIVGTQYADAALDSEVTIQDSLWTHDYTWTARAAGGLSRAVYDEVSAFQNDPFGGISGVGGNDVAGVGGALNLGASYALQPNLLVSVHLTDLGLIRWSQDAQTISDDDVFRFDGFELDIDRLQNEFDGEVGEYVEHQADSLARATYEAVDRERAAFSTPLPTALHVSSTWATDQLTLVGSATVGLRGTAGAARAASAVHLAGEYRLGPIPLRMGVQVGGAQAVTLAGGLGVRVGGYRFDLGVRGTPSTSTLGQGGHYGVRLSLATVQF
ncbi:MAG: DUF5723 family protein [Salinibacter sp.]|uniref:DUF5723 family protein n=1 Tax=Salinibacter sp. TaxID=2065818 RepID=UPI002FC33B78